MVIHVKVKKGEDVPYFEISKKKKKCVEHWHRSIFFYCIVTIYLKVIEEKKSVQN